jgi:hypothetical protein
VWRWRPVLTGLLGLVVTACAGGAREKIALLPPLTAPWPTRIEIMPELLPDLSARPPAAPVPQPSRPRQAGARIVTPGRRLQCVPYARAVSKVAIRGNARTWWRQAKGRYDRGRRPTVGSVLVLKPNGHSRGHLAVVTAILGDREVVVDHANWLNKGRIHLSTPVKDVSRHNDWSAVRVWYTPGNDYGARKYAAHGFIYPAVTTAAR